MNHIKADWIAVDWGTTHIRVWAMTKAGEVLANGLSDKGMNQLSPDAFEPALLELIEHWLPKDRTIKVIACGMVGAKQGWVEASYQNVPCYPAKDMTLTKASTLDPRIECFILPGLMQASPVDIMRGEECQIAGLISDDAAFDAVVCLPGTHAKWVRVVRGEVKNFSTYMTGELFSLLSEHSVLRHSINTDKHNSALSDPHFFAGVAQAVKDPQLFSAQLFSIRAQSIASDLDAVHARSTLSGLLIGAELAATEDLWRKHKVTLIGSKVLAGLYEKALQMLGAHSVVVNANEMTLAGLALAYKQISN